ncbi:hypothetical protein DO021_21150 [Desulfobacter hydrogenophilus]|uniref:Uncharacterized protein n=1 Tax=Desulfobacter hydrogenophilus TaxID=2291 RepID=A0A328FA98_9BACT|nr:hypothetical protein [Desulfobacter hydrogenophilus]NDY71393.1 hypothetical protein [Desulfobacter hydrogenophilus]QBH12133.1 hypothetical protein EYB58_03840 [Desulfobacter hydrogenophilus]RAM00055.1 hypothetical protein DO021_21150 [Desulfobacter hydrogenophilus]
MTFQRNIGAIRILFMAYAIFLAVYGPAHARPSVYVPNALAPWEEWVLHGKEEQLACIPMYNNAGQVLCAWPGQLNLNLTDSGGTFEQSWQVYAQTRVDLPGSGQNWPMQVLAGEKPAVVLDREDTPGLILSPGRHAVSGTFHWRTMPEKLNIPASTGLVSLKVNDRFVPFPDLDDKGRLWLKHRDRNKRVEDRLKIECFRLIEDDIPARMSVDLTLEVSGQARQMVLGPVYQSDSFTPVSFDSPLPARLESDGRITIQVRPGRYKLALNLRHAGPLETVRFIRPDQAFWPDQEIWSFGARTDLRRVQISGAQSVDPKQTAMPARWQSFPSYLMAPDTTLVFKQIKRGDPEPAPDQLSMDRTLWLRFDGAGYFIQDKITGTKNTNWRLEMNPAIHPGQVLVDGQEQLITKKEDSDKAGIELRNGRINIVADATFENGISSVPATGWDHDFNEVTGTLHLPAGWTLINARGVDRIPGTWVGRWTLLDFFVVLIFTIALSRVYSKPLAILAFFTLVLIFHEHQAPKYIWLTLLVGFTLLKYLPGGKMHSFVKFCQGLALVCFAAIVIPFAIQTLRIGIYPELARTWTDTSSIVIRSESRDKVMEMADGGQNPARAKAEQQAPAPKKLMRIGSLSKSMYSDNAPTSGSGPAQVMQYDPKARTQTGPGMPLWPAYETIPFSWSGPVSKDQSMGFFLIGPNVNLALAFLRVALVVLLGAGMLGIGRGGIKKAGATGIKQMLPAFCVLVLCLTPALSHATEFPPKAMLEELEKRLLETDKCFNNCANLPLASIELNKDMMKVRVTVHAAIDTAIPIPGDVGQWHPSQVTVDGRAAAGLFKKEGQFWVMVPKGHHNIDLDGAIRQQGGFQLFFPLKPRHLDIVMDGWTVEGSHPDGSFDAQLQFKQKARADGKNQQVLETGVLPAFARVERTLLLGLVWKVNTRIIREGEKKSSIKLDIPLLPGESITTQGIRVEGNTAKVNFRSGQKTLTWESFLAPSDKIELQHADTRDWTEIWKVDVSPVFHMAYQGTPVIFHKTGTRWYPTWHPWPGETLTLNVTRPQGIEGQTMTIEKSVLTFSSGRVATTAQLDLTINSSQGGRHTITLPKDVQLQEVKIQGRIRPIRQDQNQVTLPIVPGYQEIVLQWVSAAGITPFYKTPAVDLGMDSANTCVDIKPGSSRWPLFLGGEPAVGPAVLFWSELIVILILAFVLSKTGWTPLNLLQWFLLFIGISMNYPAAAIIVAGWLIALDLRPKADSFTGMKFNLVQLGIVVLTLASGACLVFSISKGLLGHPDMNIRGNGSSTHILRWYHDVSGPVLPRTWMVSIPMWAYRVAMLAWALWVSFWLINILKWGWTRFCTPILWSKVQWRKPTPKSHQQAYWTPVGKDREQAGSDQETDPGPKK